MEQPFFDNARAMWRLFNGEPPSTTYFLDASFYKKMMDAFQIGEYYFFIFNFSTIEFDYISAEVSNILGYRDNEVTARQILEAIHPDDREHFLRFEQDYGKFIATLPREKINKYKLRYDFRIRHKNGKYRRILHQTMIIDHDDRDFLHSICVHTDITFLKKHNIPQFAIVGYDGEPSYYFKDFYPVKRCDSVFELSEREQEVLECLLSGKSSREIAELFFVSQHTVNTHRKHILAKTGCRNIQELMTKYQRLE